MIERFKIQNSKFKIFLAAAIFIMFTAPAKAWAADPYGWLDAADCSSFRGWTCDGDNNNQSIDVHFYTDGNQFIGATTANQNRSDLISAGVCGNTGNHGFTFNTPSSLKDGQNHTIYAFGINIPSGNNPQLSGSPKTINCIVPPPTPATQVEAGCIQNPNTGTEVKISWTSAFPQVTYIDISRDNFTTFYNKYVGGTTYTTASAGFNGYTPTGVSGPLTLQPNTTYQVRLWNGQLPHGNTATFTTPASCAAPQGSIQASPNPCTFPQGSSQCTSTISWSTTNAPNPRVWIDGWTANSGHFSTGIASGSQNANWISASSATFILYANGNSTSSWDELVRVAVRGTPPTPVFSATSCGSGTTRATGLVSAPNVTNFNTSGACVRDSKASFAAYKIPSFDDLKSLYYIQAKTTGQVQKNPPPAAKPISLTGSKDHLYYFTNDLAVTSPADIAGSRTGIIFVEGNLNIGPIPGNKLNFGNNNAGLVFVVKGSVNIDKDITQIDAVIIAEGVICTAYSGTACLDGTATTPALTINGSLVSIDQDPNHTCPASCPIKFRRSLDNNSCEGCAAEKIVQQPKYMVILRNIFADTLQKWSEIQ